MKLNKILAVALAALSLTACDDDEKVNTVPVTVNWENSTMSVTEDVSAGVYYNVPLVLNAETNGPVTVTVDVKGVGASAAEEGRDYVVTQKTIVIPAGSQTGSIEFYPVGDKILNPDREFLLTITSASGASIGTESTCKITLVDNEVFLEPVYKELQGAWTMFTDDGQYTVNIVGAEPGEEGYLDKIWITGINGQAWCVIEGSLFLDAVTQECTISMKAGQIIAEQVNFTGLGVMDVALATYNGESLSTSGNIAAQSNADKTSFAWNSGICGALMQGGSFSGYIWFGSKSVSMAKAH
ncbi:MAG: hypothetical protein NC338_01185 [Firmicutes bacterium]|nr:hypothetical protein [Bacillota bacterium]MCM1401695.1 hypothetical protein [Bacteroides sp.]MCM1477503.1 hypothetical protein [Bacteroides sp.]